MSLLWHVYLSPRYLSLLCRALCYHGREDREPYPSWAIHEGLSWIMLARFWWAQPHNPIHTHTLIPHSSPSSPVWEGDTSEMKMKMLPKDSIHIQAFMHLTTARGGEKEGGRGKQGTSVRDANLLFQHSVCDSITCDEIRAWNKVLMAPLPWHRRETGVVAVSVMKSFLLALHYEQVVTGSAVRGAHTLFGLIALLSIYPSRRSGWRLPRIPFGKYDGSAIRQGQGR